MSRVPERKVCRIEMVKGLCVNAPASVAGGPDRSFFSQGPQGLDHRQLGEET